MAKRVLIEVQDKQGVWIHFRKVANNPGSIRQARQAALKSPIASKSQKTRVVDADTNSVLKIEDD